MSKKRPDNQVEKRVKDFDRHFTRNANIKMGSSSSVKPKETPPSCPKYLSVSILSDGVNVKQRSVHILLGENKLV